MFARGGFDIVIGDPPYVVTLLKAGGRRADWESLHAEAGAEVKRLTAGIEAAEREIDKLVYEAFELTADEIALLEKSLAGQF